MYLMTIDTNVDIVFLTLNQQERNLNLMCPKEKYSRGEDVLLASRARKKVRKYLLITENK